MFRNYKMNVYVLGIFYIGLYLVYVILSESYISISEKNYTTAIKNEIENMISTRELDTFLIAKNLSRNKRLINVLKTKNYKELYTKNFFQIPKEYFDYNEIHIHVVDKDGIQRFFSWTKKDLGNSVFPVRKDLKELFKKPHPLKEISVGKFNITFKGVMPIYDKDKKFLGIIETIASFDKIAQKLKKDGIESVIVIDKEVAKRLKYSKSKLYIQGYNISNSVADKDVIKLIKKYGILYFINNEDYMYVVKEGNIVSGYYTIEIPIKNLNNKNIGYYIAFIDDKFKLASREVILNAILIFLSILFLLMAYMAQKEHLKGMKLIENLDKEVKRQINEKLKLVYVDILTGAYKKLKFDEDIANNKDKKVVLLNIKNFSKINGTYGFDVGDKILKICVKRIENILKRKIYRLNADEFLFFTKKPKDEIKLIKDKFLNDSIKIEKDSVNLRISFSFGVAKADIDKLASKLSIAVAKAKKYPFSEFMYYREKKRDDSFIKFNSLLYEAIFRDNDASIIPFFQALRNNQQKRIFKFESLVRLKVKDKIYTPYYFLEIAKNSGFMHEITKIMIEKSCAHLSKMDKHIEMSINITEDDLATRQLKDVLMSTLEKYEIEPRRITLEVLEGVTAVGAKNNIKQLAQLKELGFRLAVDDFGVEYSNFERLNELDIDYIKIDGKYIKQIHTNLKSYKITKAITDFAHSLDIGVVAEFVENEEIQKVVEALGIECSQGFYFSKPQDKMSIS